MMGTAIQDVMKSSDEFRRLWDTFEKHDFDSRLPLHTSFRDSFGISFGVEVFHAHFQDLNGNVCYIVGIREEAERQRDDTEGNALGITLKVDVPLPHNVMSVSSKTSAQKPPRLSP